MLITGQSSIQKLAADFGIIGKTLPTSPYLSNLIDNAPFEQPVQYQALVGKLLYIGRMWRPDIRYIVGNLCTKNSRPSMGDWQKALHVTKYLLRTKDEGIQIAPWTGSIDIFTDAGEEKLEEKATTGILVKSGSTPLL